jgi:hypothetical protein
MIFYRNGWGEALLKVFFKYICSLFCSHVHFTATREFLAMKWSSLLKRVSKFGPTCFIEMACKLFLILQAQNIQLRKHINLFKQVPQFDGNKNTCIDLNIDSEFERILEISSIFPKKLNY